MSIRNTLEELWHGSVQELDEMMGRYLSLEAALSNSPDDIVARQRYIDDARHRAAEVRQELGHIEAALRRLEQGTYGQCVGCHQPIDPARLEANPEVASCLPCASRIPRSA